MIKEDKEKTDEEEKMVELTFKFQSEAVSPISIKEMWELFKSELKARGYNVDSIEMPEIIGIICHETDYDRNADILARDTEIDSEEYGEPSTNFKSSAGIRDISGKGEKWLMLICKGRGTLEHEVKHEISHVFEFFLGLKRGTLASTV